MTITFEQFLVAIAGQESGGDYRAVNKSSGALGKYQVMPSNVASWSREALGRSITTAQFLASPALQEQVVRHKLQTYYNKYGARGAAAAWYSGRPERANDYSSVHGGPSVGAYVDSVLGRAGQSPSKGGGGGMPPNVNDATKSYGYIEDLARKVPELRSILNTAISQGWDATKFQAAIEDSRWWKTHSDSVRQRLIQQVTDPGSYKQDLGEALRRVDQMVAQVGLKLDARSRQYAASSVLSLGWNDVDLHNFVGSHGGITAGAGGEYGQHVTKLAQLMADYGFSSPGQVSFAAKRIVAGADTIESWQQRWQSQAASMFPGLRTLLEQGQTLRQAADPYVQSYAQTLELNPASIDITKDVTLRNALTAHDPKTGQPGIMPLWQFGQALRHDPRYDKTQQAKTDAFALLHQIGKDWGFAS